MTPFDCASVSAAFAALLSAACTRVARASLGVGVACGVSGGALGVGSGGAVEGGSVRLSHVVSLSNRHFGSLLASSDSNSCNQIRPDHHVDDHDVQPVRVTTAAGEAVEGNWHTLNLLSDRRPQCVDPVQRGIREVSDSERQRGDTARELVRVRSWDTTYGSHQDGQRWKEFCQAHRLLTWFGSKACTGWAVTTRTSKQVLSGATSSNVG